MKFTSLLAGALALGSALAFPTQEHKARSDLIARAGGSSRGSSSRSGRRPDDIDSSSRTRRSGDRLTQSERDVGDIMERSPLYPVPWNPHIPDGEPVREGMTGFQYYPPNRYRNYGVIVHFYGDLMPYHADHQRYFERAYPETYGQGYRIRTSEGSLRGDTLAGTPMIPHTDADENPPQSWLYHDGAYTVMAVPHQESKFQMAMIRNAKRICPNCVQVSVDNRSGQTVNIRGTPLRGPAGVRGYPDPGSIIARQPASSSTNYMYPAGYPRYEGPVRNPDPNPNSASSARPAYPITYAPNYNNQYKDSKNYYRSFQNGKRDAEGGCYPCFQKRQIGVLQGEQDNATDTSNVDAATQISEYLYAYDMFAANATMIIQPYIEALMNGSSHPWVEMQAWSLYSMVSPGVSMMGTFMGGMDSLDNMTQWNIGNNTWMSADQQKALWDYSDHLGDFNTFVWNEVETALNSSGILSNMAQLEDWLTSANQTLIPSDETTVDPHFQEPFLAFLEQMYAYNGFAFNSTQTDNGTVDESQLEIPPWIQNATGPNNGTDYYNFPDLPSNITVANMTNSTANSTAMKRRSSVVRLY